MILEALAYGAIIGLAFPAGALVARLNRWGHRGFAVIMAIGAGLLLAAALVELAPDAVAHLGLGRGVGVIIGSAAIYSLINYWLSKRGAKHRKRCGGCVAPASEDEQSRSGSAIAVGTVMDAVPEALVLGVAAASMGTPSSLVIALFLGNLAQAASATSGLQESGRSPRFIWTLWMVLAVFVTLCAGLAAFLANGVGDAFSGVLMGVASGVLLAMISEAMLPEASEGSTPLIGVMTAAGAGLFLMLHH